MCFFLIYVHTNKDVLEIIIASLGIFLHNLVALLLLLLQPLYKYIITYNIVYITQVYYYFNTFMLVPFVGKQQLAYYIS